MINIKDKSNCCGCAACESVCPQKCIKLKADEEGFKYPEIVKGECTDCGLCESVCPFLSRSGGSAADSAFIMRHKSGETASRCTSGGAFTAIAEEFIRGGGVVYGAAFESGMNVRHVRVDSLDGLNKLSGSKYVQSDMSAAFSSVKADLADKRKVLFSAAPCQVRGLYNTIKNMTRRENLFIVDFVCRAVSSPLAWKIYIDEMQERFGSEVASANFRSKKYGYHNSVMHLNFKNKKSFYGSVHVDSMRKSFFTGLNIRPSCLDCPERSKTRVSDITLFDCWHANEAVNRPVDDNKGWTAVLSRTQKGKELIDSVNKTTTTYSADAENMIKYDGIMILQNPDENPDRERFFQLMNKKGVLEAVCEISPITRADKARELVKNILCKTKIMRILKK